MSSIAIGARVFPSVQSLREAAVRVRSDATLETLLSAQDQSFVLALFRAKYPDWHEASPVTGIDVVHQNGGRCFRFHHADGTLSKKSFQRCFSPAASKPRQVVHKAFRRLIYEDQTRPFLDAFFADSDDDGYKECPVTRVWMIKHDAHVDHMEPNTFDVLADAFVEGLGVEYEDIPLIDHPDNFGKAVPDAVAMAWQEYHRANAQLRVIHRDEHDRITTTQTRARAQRKRHEAAARVDDYFATRSTLPSMEDDE